MPRRPRNPSGFVRKHSDTSSVRWQGIVKYPDPDKPGDWKQRSATFDHKAEAQAWVDATLAEHRTQTDYRPPSDMTLKQWLARWLADVAKARVRESTFLSYTNVAERLCSQIGQRTLAELAPVDPCRAPTRAFWTRGCHQGRYGTVTSSRRLPLRTPWRSDCSSVTRLAG